MPTFTYEKVNFMPIELALGKDGIKAFDITPPTCSVFDLGDGHTVPGLKRAGPIEIRGDYNPSNPGIMRELLGAYSATEAQEYCITMPDGMKKRFMGYVTQSGINHRGEFFATIQPTGEVKEKKVQNKKMPMGLRKFYVGSNNVTADWTHATLKEAEAHAQRLLEKGGQEEAFIVEIKRVVRKKPTPIEVTNFKGAK